MTKPGFEYTFILRRRDLVRSCLARGLRLPDIITFLSHDEDSRWFPPTFSEKQKFALIKKDIEFVNKENQETYTVTREEADLALVEYLERQQFLYMQAIADQNYALARDLSKDIAKVKGVNTEEPVRIETDIASMMRLAFQQAREKKQLATSAQTIEITSEPASEAGASVANGYATEDTIA